MKMRLPTIEVKLKVNSEGQGFRLELEIGFDVEIDLEGQTTHFHWYDGANFHPIPKLTQY